MSAHAMKAKRDQIAAVVEELTAAGVRDWHQSETELRHTQIEFEHGGQTRRLIISGSGRNGAIHGARRDVRRLCGIAPKQAQPSSVKREKRRPCTTPQQREQQLPYRPRPVGTFEANAMSAALRALKDGAS